MKIKVEEKEKSLSESSVLIEEFKKARKEFIDAVNKFPPEQREIPIVEEWALRDILAHINGWARHQIETLQQFRNNNIEPDKPINTQTFNRNSVQIRSGLDWGIVYWEFLDTGEKLIAEYKSLPQDFWERKIWDDKPVTPSDFIKIETKHYKDHLRNIS